MSRGPGASGPAVSAPDLTGPVSIVNWPLAAAAGRGRRRREPLRYAHLEIDLMPAMERATSFPVIGEIEEALREAEVTELGDLLTLTARTLHGFSAAGYRDILHWEVRPGGWLPLHALRRAPSRATVGRLLASLELKEWANVRGARAFAARMRGPGDRQLEFLLRWKHRERRHSLSLDLYGSLTREHVHAVIAALGRHLPILRSEVTAVRHGGRRR